MGADGDQQDLRFSRRAKENPLAETPERRRPELIWCSLALNDVVGEAGPILWREMSENRFTGLFRKAAMGELPDVRVGV